MNQTTGANGVIERKRKPVSLAEKIQFALEMLWILICFLPICLFVFFRKFFPPKEKNLKDKIVLITGTGSGIGKSLALEFSSLGSKVICVDVNEKDNEETVKEILSRTGKIQAAKAFVCDVVDTKAIARLKKEVLDFYGHVDVLVNNAGIVYGNTILSGDEEKIKRVVDVNLMSSYWMTRAFLPRMKERGEGHIVFTNSISSIIALGDASIYSVTKFGLNGLCLSMADEFSRDPSMANIKISSVHPYFVWTKGLLNADERSKRIESMRPEKAAKMIVTGIRRDYFQFTIPGFETGYWLLSLGRMIPAPLLRLIITTLYDKLLHTDDVYQE